MIELVGVFLQFCVFLIIFSFPLNPRSLNKLIKPNGNTLNYIDCHAVNIFIFINILLIASFFNIHLSYLFLFFFSISIICLIIRRKEYFSIINRKNFTKFIFFFIITISIFISVSYNTKLVWDGFHWITKALVFFNNEPIQNLKYSDMEMYPHLGGYIWAFFWKNSLLEYEYFGRLFYAYIHIISIFTIFNIAKFRSENLIYLLIFSMVILTYDPFLLGGYQEYLIFSTLLIASRFITTVNFNKNAEYNRIFLILFIMSSMLWFKDEGLFYFLIFGSLLIFLQKSTLKGKLITIFIILFTIYTQYYLQKNIIGVFAFHAEFLSQEFFAQISDFRFMLLKIFTITKHFIIAFIKYPLWIMVLFSLLFVKIFSKKESLNLKYFFYAFILNILLVYAIYVHDILEVEYILSVTIDRVLFQTSGFYASVFILILNKNKKLA